MANAAHGLPPPSSSSTSWHVQSDERAAHPRSRSRSYICYSTADHWVCSRVFLGFTIYFLFILLATIPNPVGRFRDVGRRREPTKYGFNPLRTSGGNPSKNVGRQAGLPAFYDDQNCLPTHIFCRQSCLPTINFGGIPAGQFVRG